LNRSFAGRRAVITGAGRGIGRGSAIALADAGAEVTLVSRTRSELEKVAEAIRLNGGRASVAPADVCDPAELEAVFEGLGQRPADILVTAAGINRPGPLLEVPVEDMAAILEVNVLGTLLPCRAFATRVVRGDRPAAVVTLSSQMGAVGYPGRAAYCASKHAVNGLTKALALEWAPQRIRSTRLPRPSSRRR